MKVVVSEVSPIEWSVEVSVEAQRVDQSFQKQLNQFARGINIPGFRKGKAPNKIVERYADPEHLKRTVFQEIGVPAYQDALQQQKFDPVGEPSLQLVQFERGKDLVFKATFEIRPTVEIEPEEYNGLEVELEHVSVGDDDISRVLDDLRRKHERTVAVEEARGLEKGDVAVVDFTSRVGDEPVENGTAENFSMDIDDHAFVPGFADNLIGLKVDEKKTFNVEFPESYGNKNLAGKDVTFDFHLRSIKKRELPELDDDFAKEASKFATTDELKANVRERLENNLRNEIGNRAMEKLARDKSLLVPRAFVTQMVQYMAESQARQMAQIGIPLEQFLASRNMTVERFVAELRPQAEQLARAEMISDAIIEKESLNISDDEVDDELRKFAEQTGQDYDAVRKAVDERNERETFRKDLLRRRVVLLLAEKSKPVLKKAEAAESEEAPAEEAAPPKKSKKKAEAADTPAEETAQGDDANREAAEKKPSRAKKKAEAEA